MIKKALYNISPASLSFYDSIVIPASTEATLAEQYLWLEQHRFPDRFEYKVTVHNGSGELQTPPLLLHSIIQEALYMHILNNAAAEKHFLEIDFFKKDETLVIRICDNGMDHFAASEMQRKKDLPEAGDNVLIQRLHAINESAISKVEMNYTRSNGKNITELILPQPLFHPTN
jgi:LytS/YehU family sensor histidine kinase